MSTPLLHFDEPGNPIRKLYKHAIDLAQGGKPDNERKQQRCYLLHQLLQQSVIRAPNADVVECGCWHGHSTLIAANVMHGAGSKGKLHVVDSFKGLSEFKTEDMSPFQATAQARAEERAHYASDMGRLQKLVEPFGFVELHKGWIPDVFKTFETSAMVTFAMIDVDLYEPTYKALEWVFPQVVKGGVIFFDDYGYNCFPGAKKAVDDYIREWGYAQLFIENPMGSAYLIK